MKRIERHNYLQKLIAFKDKKLIKTIWGMGYKFEVDEE